MSRIRKILQEHIWNLRGVHLFAWLPVLDGRLSCQKIYEMETGLVFRKIWHCNYEKGISEGIDKEHWKTSWMRVDSYMYWDDRNHLLPVFASVCELHRVGCCWNWEECRAVLQHHRVRRKKCGQERNLRAFSFWFLVMSLLLQ